MELQQLLALIGEEIKKLRMAKGWSQEKLAFKYGSEKGYQSNIEKGKANLTLKTLCNIANELGVKVKVSLE